MKKYFVAGSMVLGASIGGAGVAQAKSVSCPDTTPAQIEALFTEFNNAWATKDPAKVTSLFTKEPVLLATVSNKPRTTPAEVNDYFVGFLKSSPVGKIDTSTVEIDCNTASRLGTWTVTLTDAKTGAKTDVKARYSFLYRYEDGAWKIDHLHSSMMPEK
ncbi:SgcJ/EcaC family oxidoreductase [Rhizobium lemnae]|uniref:SgcJ/EcaC family oxidoreductase n=1 Tax=Rhizobium lemnae TaxID=1214924 RepID=A0ABV8E8I9_9HYPH|nr:SgcJ/EcaC family oxidoreductase [Rhizobium lemnae]MCJ8509532.1 SgcJ/EcaC family oxidoreductase [Rhizobium lemnae]